MSLVLYKTFRSCESTLIMLYVGFGVEVFSFLLNLDPDYDFKLVCHCDIPNERTLHRVIGRDAMLSYLDARLLND